MSASAIDHVYAHRLQAAQQVKAAGGKVAGYVSTAVPVELIMASGLHPVMITGDCRSATPLADEWMESMFDPMARVIFQAALAGDLEFLDVLIIPRTADSFLRLYLYLREIERQGICKRLPRLVLFDLLQVTGDHSARHNLAQVQALNAILNEIGGVHATEDALRNAIAASNTNRQALRELLSARRKKQVSSELVLKAITTRHLMAMTEHTTLLRKLNSELASKADCVAPRIVVAGNAQDNAALHALLDEAGFQVVGDYHWLGDSVSTHDIDIHGDALQAISNHYHNHSLSSRRFPHEPHELVQFSQACGAQGVVFYLFETEEALTWDSPNQIDALSKTGAASLVFDNQPYVIAASPDVKARLAKFADDLLRARS